MTTAITIEIALPALRLNQFDRAGTHLASSVRQVALQHPSPGQAEIDAGAVREALLSALAECVTISGVTPELLSLTGGNDGLALVGSDGGTVHPLVAETDLRAVPVVEQWIEQGIAAAAFRASGSTIWPGSPVALLRAAVDADPDIADRATLATTPLGSLAHALTGKAGLPAPLSLLPVLDPYHAAYDEELIDLLRLRHLRHLLPPVDPGPHPLEFGPDWRQMRDLTSADCILYCGSHSIAAAMLASDAAIDGFAQIHLGPVLQCATTIHRPDTGAEPGGTILTTANRQQWIRVLSSPSGLNALDWLLGLIGGSYQELNALVAESVPGANGTLAVPVMSASGERGNYLDPRARSRLVGFHDGTSRADLARAMCEGLACSARWSLDIGGSPAGEPVHFSGAGVRAPAFRQLLADVLGRPVLVDTHAEPIGRGAAMAAFIATGHPVDTAAWRSESEVVEPSLQLRGFYDEQYRRFQTEVSTARRVGGR
ncbi:MAG: hypothetical protein KF883_16610 [Thermomicrobiales bacterium]|nr:hypothetical protein [Thermomicrobiales bacterium]